VKASLNQDHPLGPGLQPLAAGIGPGAEQGPAQSKPLFPWEDPQLGLSPALGRTLKGVLFQPGRFFGGHRPGSGLAAPFIFGLAAASTGLMLALFCPALVSVVTLTRPGPLATIGFGASLAGIVLAPVPVLIWLVVQSLGGHVCLMILGAGSQGLAATLRALSYSAAACLFLPLPVVGPGLAWLWGTVVWIVGLSRLQGVSPGRVTAALLGPPLVLVLVLIYLAGRI